MSIFANRWSNVAKLVNFEDFAMHDIPPHLYFTKSGVLGLEDGVNDPLATELGSERIRECVEDGRIYLIRFAQALRCLRTLATATMVEVSRRTGDGSPVTRRFSVSGDNKKTEF